MTAPVLVYGATGYTGTLTAETAREQGYEPILAGRSVSKLRALADPLDMEWRAFPLDDVDAIRACLGDVEAVVHMAGPFSDTFRPMVRACLDAGVHYLDITGEIDVYEAAAALDDEAREREVVVAPGVGFDVVPSDCLAAHVAGRISDATHLEIAIGGFGGSSMSQGTAKTMVEGIGDGLRLRRDGELVDAPTGSVQRDVDFGDGDVRHCIAIPWGDVSMAYHSTGVPNITDYFVARRELELLSGVGRFVAPLVSLDPVQNVLKWLVERGPAGPSEEQRERAGHVIVAEARNDAGDVARSRLETPEGYTLTALTALESARRIVAGDVEPGFHTPATAFGADYVLEFDGVTREDLDAA